MSATSLRSSAAYFVRSSPMVQRAADGDPALLISTFWPFVDEFPVLIRKRLNLPRLLFVLGPRLGWANSFNKLRAMSQSVRVMANEEGDHSDLWAEAAARHGVVYPVARDPRIVSLLATLEHDPRLWCFLARLAATEYVAEELARHLPILGRWSAVHLMNHDGEPSHLEMDVELAINCHPTHSEKETEEVIISYIELFAQAAGFMDQFR